jgi:outer membrane protein OmpA-like peptidoglycan-associated protein
MSGSDGAKTTVVLTDDTDTRDRRGIFGLRKNHLGDTVLIPGLKVDVKGDADGQGRVVATTIAIDGDDLETAEMIQAGLHPTAEQVHANVKTLESHQKDISELQQNAAATQDNMEKNQQQTKEQIEQNAKEIQEQTDRFNALTDYDVKGEATVNFAVGSTSVSSADQDKLKALAQTATGLKGYIVEVIGYADSTGNPAINTKLSENRAQAVINFLVQQGSVPVRHIVAPGAMGEYGAAASNETKAGRAENRRVVAKVLVNKGMAGDSSAAQ